MTWVLSQSGTTAALTIGTEAQLGSNDTNNATFVLQVDTNNLVNGDTLEIRIYTQILSGSTAISIGSGVTQIWKGTYQHAQMNNQKVSPFVASDIAIAFSLKQTAGTGRTYNWKILRQ
jgi:hypothetical protein